jgi:hypothetical protein
MLKHMPTFAMGAPKADMRKSLSEKAPDKDPIGLICVIFSALSSGDWETIGEMMCEDIEWNFASSGAQAGEVRNVVKCSIVEVV